MIAWKMMMNDLYNDMKWHDRMTYDKLLLAVHATLAAACFTPCSLGVTEVLVYSISTH